MEDKIKLVLNIDRSSELELSDRADKMLPSGKPLELAPLEKSIHFLRGVDSRAGFALAGFYMLTASSPHASNNCNIKGYPGSVFKSYINHVSLNNISLACRKAFDHAIKGALTGATFAKNSDETLRKHAEYWSKSSGRSIDESYKALHLLRSFFKCSAKNNSELLKQKTKLGRRIALMKQYADRTASHLSLEYYELDILDVAHVVASLTLVAEIIRSFERSDSPSMFYNDLDEAAYLAAKELFPNIEEYRLFKDIVVEQQAKYCWKHDEEGGLHMLLDQIPYATGFF